MWAEQLNPETVDSRVWPRTMAVAERFWSPQSDRDVSDMYRRLRINSLKLEDVGLRHISGPEVLRRNLVLERNPEALQTLASVLEPVSFHERYSGQHTNGLTTLDRLVDAGHTVVVIEHNLDVIKTADYVIDLGPEGGDRGGEIVAKGTPEEIAMAANSHTGQFLRQVLGHRAAA